MFIKVMTTEQMINDLVCDEYANWSLEGARALVEYLEEWSDMAEQPIEWDRVAIRCDFNEYKTLGAALDDYGLESRYELEHNAVVIEFDGGLIVQEF